MMVPMMSEYNTGPNQYFGSFVLGGYDNITGDGDGMFCRIQIDASNPEYSVWDCQSLLLNKFKDTLKMTSTMPVVGGGVQSTAYFGPTRRDLSEDER